MYDLTLVILSKFQGWNIDIRISILQEYRNCFELFFEYRITEIQAKSISVLYRIIQAKPISILYRITEI